jgi:hypothetical protein
LAGEVLDGGSQGIDFEVNTKERWVEMRGTSAKPKSKSKVWFIFGEAGVLDVDWWVLGGEGEKGLHSKVSLDMPEVPCLLLLQG